MYHYLPVTCKNIVLINVQNCNFSDIWSKVLNNISNKKTKYHVLRGNGHLFVRALETGTQTNIWRAFLYRFAASANQFDIYRQCTYIVLILYCQKVQQLSYCRKRAETIVVLIVCECPHWSLRFSCYRFFSSPFNMKCI